MTSSISPPTKFTGSYVQLPENTFRVARHIDLKKLSPAFFADIGTLLTYEDIKSLVVSPYLFLVPENNLPPSTAKFADIIAYLFYKEPDRVHTVAHLLNAFLGYDNNLIFNKICVVLNIPSSREGANIYSSVIFPTSVSSVSPVSSVLFSSMILSLKKSQDVKLSSIDDIYWTDIWKDLLSPDAIKNIMLSRHMLTDKSGLTSDVQHHLKTLNEFIKFVIRVEPETSLYHLVATLYDAGLRQQYKQVCDDMNINLKECEED